MYADKQRLSSSLGLGAGYLALSPYQDYEYSNKRFLYFQQCCIALVMEDEDLSFQNTLF